MSTLSINKQRFNRLVVWIRRELRINDNHALWNAVHDAEEVIPVFIIDNEFYSFSPAKQQVVIDGLHDLNDSLLRTGGGLLIREGNPERVLPAILEDTQAEGVYFARSYDPERIASDVTLRNVLEACGKQVVEFHDNVLFPSGEIKTGQGTPYSVYTPFKNACLSKLLDIPPPLPAITHIKTPVRETSIYLQHHPRGVVTIAGGESAAMRAMSKFIGEKIDEYTTSRDLLALDGTSRLSHHLASGSLSVRVLYHELTKQNHSGGVQTYLNELLWREFFYHVLWNFPHVRQGAFKRNFDQLRWTGTEEWFEAWCEGKTGYPVVDAAMRQLQSEQWMHNRARMIVASFLTKDLHIDWRRGERFFLDHLADGDNALNNGGWQWSAGTGTDAQPWFRIFNPVLQGKKFDPQGIYIRRYIPELAHVPDAYIHTPWKMSKAEQDAVRCRLGKEYPFPVVDHEKERRITLDLYQAVKGK